MTRSARVSYFSGKMTQEEAVDEAEHLSCSEEQFTLHLRSSKVPGDFPDAAFPTSFVLLYCPVGSCETKPFKHAPALVDHLEKCHKVSILEPRGIYPFIDRYLSAHKDQLRNLNGALILGEDDVDLRQRLQTERLRAMLDLQEIERATSHNALSICLFCPQRCVDKRALFTHMYRTHDFNIGLLDNLVMVDTFLGLLRHKLSSNTCILCGKCFGSGGLLRKHLKAKKHYRIPPDAHEYDRFYLINYTQPGKLWSDISYAQEEDDKSKGEEQSDEDWSDLDIEICRMTQCLFCQQMSEDPDACLDHMSVKHKFNLRKLQKELFLSFYDSVKLLNYFRHCQICVECPAGCEFQSSDFNAADGPENLSNDFGEAVFVDEASVLASHISLKCIQKAVEHKSWNQAQYLIPIFDEDPLLEIIEELDASDQE